MGNFGRTLLDWGFSAHIGFSTVVSLGSAIDVGFGDVIDFLAEDPHTKSIILYMEEVVGNVKLFVSAVRGFARNKPVILLKPPTLEDGDSAGLTHSGTMRDPTRYTMRSSAAWGSSGSGRPMTSSMPRAPCTPRTARGEPGLPS